MHGVVVIVDDALLSLYSVMTLLEMLLWGEVPALYHLAAEGKIPLNPSLFLGTAVLHQAHSDRPDFQFAIDCTTSRSPGAGCQGLLSNLLCLCLSDRHLCVVQAGDPTLPACPPGSEVEGFLPQQVEITPLLKGAWDPQAIPASEHHFCQPHVSS